MKVLAGKFKNQSIKLNRRFSYRPTTSIARKSLFDALKSLEGKTFLDLYAGSGMIGFEASSRDASTVTFIEMHKLHMSQIRENAGSFDYNRFHFYVRDSLRFLKKCENYDIIFADPPYGLVDLPLLIKLATKKLNSGGVFVLECGKNESLAGYFKSSKFGDTQLLFWEA
jgi:16S rRNA (guanine966-N2)-methyltransferase|tara:strand:+ start:3674 stop:4180 length:507 start_codon:yes stop_codon:yes gene_type:complete